MVILTSEILITLLC